ncbi:hypothetical protein ACVV2G_32510 [Streptomyces ziwulingensis]
MTTALTHSQENAIDVTALTGAERTVALYASDMPNGRRRYTADQARAWIVQGAQRVGPGELQRRAEYFRGWRLLDMHGLTTVQVQARHEQRFPNARRLVLAHKEASGNVSRDGMTDTARKRNAGAVVDGECPCRGTGGIAAWGPGIELMCPVHRRAQIDAHHRASRAGA